jgi:exosortase A
MSAIPADLPRASPWRQALPAMLGLLAAILLLYRDTATTMVGIWYRSETFAHAFLVVPISLWLIWRQRERLALLTPRAQPWLLLLLLGAAVVWLLADLVVVNAAAQFALVGMLILAVPAVLGLEVAGAILFPLLFLLFAVPFGEFMVPTMMLWTADFAVAALQLTGVPVYREGMHFVIPSGNWSVIDECSGVRYLMASFMVGSLFAYLNYRSYTRRVVFMLVSIVLPIVANWVRAYMIVMIAHLSDNKLAAGVDHILYGWVFFGLIIMIMFVVGARWSQPDEAPAAPRTGGPLRAAASGWTSAVAGTALAGALVVLLPHAALWGLQRAEGAAGLARLELPARLATGWAATGAPAAWEPIFVNPSVEAKQTYAGPAGTVGVYLAYYRAQQEGRKLVSSVNVNLPMRGSDWNEIATGAHGARLGGQAVTVRIAELLDRDKLGADRRHLVVWRVYWIDGRWVGGDVAAKLAGALARLRGRGDEGAALVLHTDAGSVAASHAALQSFVDANAAALNDLLQRTRDAR